MRIVYLRELVEAGFCGSRAHHEKSQVRARTHVALDKIIAQEGVRDASNEGWRVQAANRYGIPFEELDHFNACLEGIANLWPANVTAAEREWSAKPYDAEDGLVIRATTFEAANSGTPLEPHYGHYVLPAFVPVHAIAIARLSGKNGNVYVDTIPARGSKTISGNYPINAAQIDELISGGLDNYAFRVGWQCGSCQVTRCNVHGAGGIEADIKEWLQTKKRLQDMESRIREHLAMRGPQEFGMHQVFLKEHRRRFFRDENFPEFMNAIIQANPKGYLKYLSPDAASVAEAIEKGDLPEDLRRLFKESSYTTIEGGLAT